tara:strand:+ start:110 stop:817 length:708 start_codon:yes stop_codon:yes gene_type:complete
MKLILENWKKYLKEEEEKPLGKYVWPKDSLLVDPEKEKEINTALEDKLKDSVEDHFKGTLLNRNSVADLKYLINKDLYPKIFKRHTKGEVYRGIYVTREWMKKTFGDTGEFETLHKESDPEMVEVDYSTIIPLIQDRIVSSWTTQFDSAKSFAKAPLASQSSSGYGKNISLVLVADASDPLNYFIDMDPFYDYKFGKNFVIESEVVGVGAIKTTKLMWTDTSWHIQRSKYEKGKK